MSKIKGAILLADGFEEVEAIMTRDLLLRTHSIDVDLVSIKDDVHVKSNHSLEVTADGILPGTNIDSYDFLVLPGGKIGVENLSASEAVKSVVREFLNEHKLVAAICAAPSILGDMGALDHAKYTCFPGFQRGAGEYFDVPAVKDQNIITGHSMAYTIDFASLIIRYFLGKSGMECIKNGIYGI